MTQPTDIRREAQTPLRALTIRQPWADAIVHGAKRVENRTWAAPAKHHGSRVLLHAAAGCDRTVLVLPDGSLPAPEPMWTRGALMAVATLTGCHQAAGDCCVPWGEPGVWHWQFTDVRPLPEPIPCKGALGLWAVAPELQRTLSGEASA